MRISYNRLWNLMKNKMKKRDLVNVAKISEYAMTKINRDEAVALEFIICIYKFLYFDIGDVL